MYIQAAKKQKNRFCFKINLIYGNISKNIKKTVEIVVECLVQMYKEKLWITGYGGKDKNCRGFGINPQYNANRRSGGGRLATLFPRVGNCGKYE